MFCPYMFYKVSLNQKQVVFSMIPIFREDSQCNDITKGLLRWFLVIQPKKPKQPKRLQKRMKFYLYMSDTQAEVCQDIVNLVPEIVPLSSSNPIGEDSGNSSPCAFLIFVKYNEAGLLQQPHSIPSSASCAIS